VIVLAISAGALLLSPIPAKDYKELEIKLIIRSSDQAKLPTMVSSFGWALFI
jgi:hypothetical protein